MAESESGTQGLLRLKRQHKTIIEGLDAKISQLEGYFKDYEAVDRLLEDLPKRLNHSGTIIPFSGKKALVQGVLQNTNEVMVYLGSDHFASVSSHHCRGIVQRRKEALRTQINASKEERSLLAGRLNFTDDFLQERSSEAATGGLVEIREDLDEEKEAIWRERHRRLVAEERRNKSQTPEDGELTESDILRRLDDLERQEEAETMAEQEAALSPSRLPLPIIHEDTKDATAEKGRRKKNLRVHFEDTDVSPEEEDERGDGRDEEEERDEGSPGPSVIRFHHTPSAPSVSPPDTLTPANLIAFCALQSSNDNPDAAVKDVVIERPSPSEIAPVPAPASQQEEASTRPTSRFRARRLNR